jgi:hypothetical protein
MTYKVYVIENPAGDPTSTCLKMWSRVSVSTTKAYRNGPKEEDLGPFSGRAKLRPSRCD